jgi:hypothetical protein
VRIASRKRSPIQLETYVSKNLTTPLRKITPIASGAIQVKASTALGVKASSTTTLIM